MLDNVEVRSCTNIDEFNFLYDDIFNFCKKAIEETILQQQKEGVDYSQTLTNMDYQNWETNKECFLYGIYKTKKYIDNNGMCTFLYKDEEIIAASGVEFWNKDVAIVSKRTFVLTDYRLNFINSYFLIPEQKKWVQKINPNTKIIMVTFNKYLKDHSFKSIKKAISLQLDGPWNIWKTWKVYPDIVEINYTQQYIIYELLDKTIENKYKNIIKIINKKEL